MRVKILGSAAGGGFPQWNCACRNCRALRAGTFPGKARTQTQVAISVEVNHNDKNWFLLGASPDLRAQIGRGTEQEPVLIVMVDFDADCDLGLRSGFAGEGSGAQGAAVAAGAVPLGETSSGGRA